MKKGILSSIAVSVVALVILVSILLLFYARRKYVMPSLKEVDEFSRAQEFSTSFLGHSTIQQNVQGKNISTPIFGEHNPLPGKMICHPKGKLYYICDKTSVSLYSYDNVLMKATELEKMGLPKEDYEFGRIIGIDEKHIWVSLKQFLDEYSKNGRILRGIKFGPILEINSQDLTLNTLYDVNNFRGAIIDPCEAQAFFVNHNRKEHKSEIGTYDLRTRKFVNSCDIEYPYISMTFLDHVYGRGILISDFSCNKNSLITLYRPKTRKSSLVTSGWLAHWGDDGYIYFLRGYTQLWRIKHGKPAKPVYLLTRRPKFIQGNHSPSYFWIGADKSFLAYDYSAPLWNGGWRLGLVLIDLEKNEFRDIDMGIFK